jgi:drug/metabolite transporter (DMT)-like permease
MSRQPDRHATVPTAIRDTFGWGIALAFGAALISGLSIYLNAFAVKQMPDAAVYTTLKNAVAAAILLATLVVLGGARDVRAIGRHRWPAIVTVGVIGGGVPFILFFTGLAQASAPGAAFIQKTLFVWVAMLAVPFLGERLGIASIAGLATLLVGQALVLPPDGIVWGTGETMILAATLLWAVEVVLVKRLVADVPSQVMASLRLGIGLVVLFGFLAATGRIGVLGTLSTANWGWVLLTGLLLAGYVATWFGALRRAPASVVTSVLVLGAVVTGALTSVTKGAAPSPVAVVGYGLITIAVLVLAVLALADLGTRVARASIGQPSPTRDVGLAR